jgi:peptide/nickel transport system permease protein
MRQTSPIAGTWGVHVPQEWLRPLIRHVARILLVAALGGFLGATLVRLVPGFGVDEEALDSRLNQQSQEALRQAHAQADSLPGFYARYWMRVFRGDLGESETLHEPVRQLLAERFPERLKSVGAGLALAWTAGLGLALAAVMARTRIAGALASAAASALLCIPAAVLALLFVLAQAPGRLAIGVIVFPKIFHFARGLLARTAAMPHVLAARARGVSGAHILWRHILPVAGPQLLALCGVSINLAFAAVIPVEALCDLPGIGHLAWQAAMGRDLALLVNLTTIVALVTLMANSAADLAARRPAAGAA